MLLIGLTGGIGAGKSTVATMLTRMGAMVLDADKYALYVVRQGEPAYEQVVARFGDGVVGPDGELDRGVLAAAIFSDPAARADLEAIIHPAVRERIAMGIAATAGTDRVVVLESPLLIETGSHRNCQVVVVVDAPMETRLARLEERGMTREQAQARIDSQMSAEERLAAADVVLDNSGTKEDLEARIRAVWPKWEERARGE